MLSIPSAGFGSQIERCIQGVVDSASAVSGFDASLQLRPAANFGDRERERVARYLELVVQWGERVDLTAARDEDELVDLFVADAVVLAATTSDMEDWVDIGTGAGAPGLPLQLFRPNLQMCLVEPRAKRVAFLRSAVGALAADDIRVVRGRAEAVRDGAHEVAVSRATWAPDRWLVEGARLARRHVWVLLATAEPPTLPGWQVDAHCRYEWPLTGVSRSALRFVRI